MNDFNDLWFNCEECETNTSIEQCRCEKICSEYLISINTYSNEQINDFKKKQLINEINELCLIKSLHIQYLTSNLLQLPGGFVSLDSNKPWILYWILHPLNLLNAEPIDYYSNVIYTLNLLQNNGGGYSGGLNQLPHCAPTYAAVLALCIVGTEESLSSINRSKLYKFFLLMKDASGGFRMHHDGEVDCRGTYTVIAIARICNILTPELTEGVVEFLLRCQSFDGGFGGEPGNEGHGGYNFCALAALCILGKANDCNLSEQIHWLVHRQLKLEGGFQGRTNKLVDACYSFWQGSALAIIEIILNNSDDLTDLNNYLSIKNNTNSSSCTTNQSLDEDVNVPTSQRIKQIDDLDGDLLFNQLALQRYILHCGQQIENGGLRDKPGKHRDFYHSCYALSGLSIAQHSYLYNSNNISSKHTPLVYGDVDNLLNPTSAVYNISLDKLNFAINYFSKYSNRHDDIIN